ncbi:GSCOCG00005491001-RA-CDS, partial [Cotesia congregata]
MVTSEPEDHLVCSFECRRRHPRGERGRGLGHLLHIYSYPRCLTLQRMGIVTGPDYSRLECVRLFYFFLCLPGVYLGSLKVRVCSASAGSAGNPVSASGLRSSQACAASYS